MTQEPDAALLALLDTERSALLAGDLSALDATTDRKVRLASAVAEISEALPKSRLAELAAAAQRNVDLCEAARRGLRDAIDRISERVRVARNLETYGSDGKRYCRDFGPPRLEKRS